MSQATFALALNVSTVLISKWGRGEVRPSGPSLKLLTLAEKKGIEDAKVADLVRHGARFGSITGSRSVDMKRVLARKREMVEGLIATLRRPEGSQRRAPNRGAQTWIIRAARQRGEFRRARCGLVEIERFPHVPVREVRAPVLQAFRRGAEIAAGPLQSRRRKRRDGDILWQDPFENPHHLAKVAIGDKRFGEACRELAGVLEPIPGEPFRLVTPGALNRAANIPFPVGHHRQIGTEEPDALERLPPENDGRQVQRAIERQPSQKIAAQGAGDRTERRRRPRLARAFIGDPVHAKRDVRLAPAAFDEATHLRVEAILDPVVIMQDVQKAAARRLDCRVRARIEPEIGGIANVADATAADVMHERAEVAWAGVVDDENLHLLR